jgi:myo-inositol 2-dehydrogenase/D-chiro-inositol 1-dehydrogenase
MIVLRTSSGRLCHINNSRSAVYGCDQRVELLGAAGMLLSDNRRPHELRSFGREFTAARAPLLHFFLERYREAFERQFESFVRAVRGEAVVEVGFEDGRRALVLAEAAYESVETGKSVRVAAASP